MLKFRDDNLKEPLNTRSRRCGGLFDNVRVYILALVTAISLFLGGTGIYAQQLFVGSIESNEVLLYDGETGDFINEFVSQQGVAG